MRVMALAEMRVEVLLEAARSGETVTAVCERHGISRETCYAYRRRFRSGGVEGLEPRSRQPLHQLPRMPATIEEKVCRIRKEHPRWARRRSPAPPFIDMRRQLRCAIRDTPSQRCAIGETVSWALTGRPSSTPRPRVS